MQIVHRIVRRFVCSNYKVMGPWDQDYIGQAISICTLYYVQSNGTMEPRLYCEGFFNLCTELGTKQWDHGTKIILWRLFQFVHCTRYKVMGPWDQDYIGETFSICTLYYVQSNGTMEPRFYWGGFFNLYTVLRANQWDHGTKIILGRLFQFVHCTTFKSMGPWSQDYIGEAFLICTLFYV
jgi:hypothetical protein